MDKKKVVFVIVAVEGEYSDRVETLECAFNDEEKAKEYILQKRNEFGYDIRYKYEEVEIMDCEKIEVKNEQVKD